METREYRNIDKSAWGEGPWQSEPDKRQWQDEATGLPCLIVRQPHGGNLCGYVGVPPGSPLHGQDYEVTNVDVHGGLTFAEGCGHGEDESRGICHVPGVGEPDAVWWFGFDCAHVWDRRPGDMRFPDLVLANEVYRTFEYVEHECRRLAEQLAAAERLAP